MNTLKITNQVSKHRRKSQTYKHLFEYCRTGYLGDPCLHLQRQCTAHHVGMRPSACWNRRCCYWMGRRFSKALC